MKKKITKLLALLLACVMLLALAACGGNNNASDQGGSTGTGSGTSPDSGSSASSDSGSGSGSSTGTGPSNPSTAPADPGRDTFITTINSTDSGTLSPAYLTYEQYGAVMLVHEYLWDQNWDNELIYVLATHVTENTPLNWLIHLREGVTFHNGNPFTAHDVLFSMTLHKNSGWVGSPRVQDVDIENCKVIDDHTLEVNWLRFNIKQYGILSDMAIYDEESFDEQKSTVEPIGTGPYKITDYVVNSHIFLEKRDDYWGDSSDMIKYMQFKFVAEPAQRVTAIETGAVDVTAISADDFDHVSNMSGVNVFGRYTSAWSSILFNVNPVSAFHDVEARYALCHALNRQSIINLVYLGHARLMKGPTTEEDTDHESWMDNLHETYSVGYNVERAKELADKAGLSGKTINVILNGTSVNIATAEMIQNMLQAIGVTVNINTFDNAGYRAARDGDPAVWDFAITNHVSPGQVTANRLVNEVRNMVIFNAPIWDGYEEYTVKAPLAYAEPDPVLRKEITRDLLIKFNEACLYYAICEAMAFTAEKDYINHDSLIYRSNAGLMYRFVRFN